MVAHAEEFYSTAFGNKKDESKIPEVATATKKTGAYVTPNLSAFEAISRQWGKPEVVTAFLADPRAKFMWPGERMDWADSDYAKRKGEVETVLVFLRKFTTALHEAGVPLLTGTDSPNIPGMLPGFSIHDDLRTLTEAGLTPYEALTAATRTPGRLITTYVASAKPFGEVKVGMRADFVLVTGNPLEDLETLKEPIGVMTGGRWRTAHELMGDLERQKAKYDQIFK